MGGQAMAPDRSHFHFCGADWPVLPAYVRPNCRASNAADK